MRALVWILLILTGCGSNLPSAYGPSREVPQKILLNGQLPDTDGGQINLNDSTQSIVVMFVTNLCISCKEETANLIAHFQTNGGLPKNVRFITVMAGGTLERAKKWKETSGLTWTMASDANGALFLELCSPEKLTPCVFTQNPKTDPPVKRHIGLTSIEQLESETGRWIYGGKQ